jgi:hypothetical protein
LLFILTIAAVFIVLFGVLPWLLSALIAGIANLFRQRHGLGKHEAADYFVPCAGLVLLISLIASFVVRERRAAPHSLEGTRRSGLIGDYQRRAATSLMVRYTIHH